MVWVTRPRIVTEVGRVVVGVGNRREVVLAIVVVLRDVAGGVGHRDEVVGGVVAVVGRSLVLIGG